MTLHPSDTYKRLLATVAKRMRQIRRENRWVATESLVLLQSVSQDRRVWFWAIAWASRIQRWWRPWNWPPHRWCANLAAVNWP